MPPQPNDESQGPLDQLRLEALYRRLEKPVFNVVYRWLWDRGEAHDVTQEAFLRLWRARDRVEVATVEPLLYRTAINLASSRRRMKRLREWVTLEAIRDRPSDHPAADRALEQEREKARIRRAVAGLPERLKRVVLLCEFSGMSQGEVAAALAIPAGTVASRRHEAMKRLVVELGPIEEES